MAAEGAAGFAKGSTPTAFADALVEAEARVAASRAHAGGAAELKASAAGKGGRGLWKITKEGTDRAVQWGSRTISRHESTGLWWSKDTARHGGSTWKVFKEERDGLRHFRDADEYGDFIVGKHKGPVGEFIPWSQLAGK